MLPFHDDIQADLARSDSLVVLARGLGMPHAFARHVFATLSPDALTIGLNISRPVATQVVFPTLAAHAPTPAVSASHRALLLPRFINADYAAKDRALVYAAGGFVVATASVLVHDFLHAALPAARVAGILVYAADAVREGSNEHFALKLFRAANSQGFVAAFSENAPALARGFHHVEKLMRTLFVSHLSLWPRFHAAVKPALAARAPDLVDLSVQLTTRMAALVAALRDVVHAVLHDLRLATREVDFSEVYRDPEGDGPARKRLAYNFDDAVRRQLEGADVRVTGRVRTLVADLTALRRLLRDVFELNAVAFYQGVVTLRHAAEQGNSWLVRKEAQRAVLLSRSRVWVLRKAAEEEPVNGVGSGAQGSQKAAVAAVASNEMQLSHARGAAVRTVATLEGSPKWAALRDVLKEIRTDVEAVGAEADVGRVLVTVREEQMVDELKAVLRDGGESYLQSQFEKTFPSAARRAKESEELSSKSEDGLQQVTMTQLAQAAGGPIIPRRPEPSRDKSRRKQRPSRERKVSTKSGPGWREERSREMLQEVFREVKSEKSSTIEVLIWCMEWVDLQGRGHRILEEYRPAFVVLYNTDMAVVREVEVYKASHPGRPVRLYLLAYDDAAEEERFRSASNREKNAFKSLIRERATMTIHVDQEGRRPEEEFTQSLMGPDGEGVQSLGRRGLGGDRDSRVTISRRSGPLQPVKEGRVLVDTRELRSSLPMLLYQSNLTIVPLTLEVGDFILSKGIGIERKSVPDLYGSFGSGRLFNQAEALCRHYKHPCLLIELDPAKSVSLTATSGGVPSELSATSIVSKMVLLMQQFPTLRLLWAQGPHDAAELFAVLKANEEEPDEEAAMRLGVDSKESEQEQFNAGPKALLRSLPGIDSQNMTRVMRQVRNVSSLIGMSKQEMTEILGSAGKAAQLYNFVNEKPSEALAAL